MIYQLGHEDVLRINAKSENGKWAERSARFPMLLVAVKEGTVGPYVTGTVFLSFGEFYAVACAFENAEGISDDYQWSWPPRVEG